MSWYKTQLFSRIRPLVRIVTIGRIANYWFNSYADRVNPIASNN